MAHGPSVFACVVLLVILEIASYLQFICQDHARPKQTKPGGHSGPLDSVSSPSPSQLPLEFQAESLGLKLVTIKLVAAA
jgi:hypothetical protein